MKKLVVILLMVAYSITSFGITIHLHYCMNKFVESGIDNKSGICNDMVMMDGMEKDKCCKHEYKQLKVENHYKDTVSVISYNKFILVIIPDYPFQIPLNSIATIVKNDFIKQPCRRGRNNKIYIFNCVYRI